MINVIKKNTILHCEHKDSSNAVDLIANVLNYNTKDKTITVLYIQTFFCDECIKRLQLK